MACQEQISAGFDCDRILYMDPKSLAPFLDLANHHPNATSADIEDICGKVKTHGFNAAFVNPYFVAFAKQKMGTGKVGTVVSFPLGQETLDLKLASARSSALAGADELDVSLNVGQIKSASWDELFGEMQKIVDVIKNIDRQKIVKFILETGYLTDDEIKQTSILVLRANADFVKTNSGMGPRGATIADVELIKNATGGKIKIKAAGGIDTYEKAAALIKAGVARIGTSKAVEIVTS